MMIANAIDAGLAGWTAVFGAALADTAAATTAAAPADAAAGSALGGSALGGIGLAHYLAIGALTFSLGLLIVIVRRNAIAVLMGIELMLNSAGLNFIAFSKFIAGDMVTGQVLTVFLIALAAAEAALALAIILNIFNNMDTVEVEDADALKG